MLKIILAFALLGLCVESKEFIENVKTVNQNYNDKVNAKIVQQIQYELKASYLYQAYSHYFGRADVSLPGFAKWFEKASLEERQHATGLIEYINKRGGTVTLNDITLNSMCTTLDKELERFGEFDRSAACICSFMSSKKDSSCGDRSTWKNGLWAMQDTLVLERFVNAELLALHKEPGVQNVEDPHLSHVLEHDYLDEQVESIKKVADYVQQLKRVGDGLGEYVFDKDLKDLA